MAKQANKTATSGGRADLRCLRCVTEREIRTTSPPELADLPANFWDDAVVVQPVGKLAISVRIDEDVLAWFRAQGPRYQSRMNAVLRSFTTEQQRKARRIDSLRSHPLPRPCAQSGCKECGVMRDDGLQILLLGQPTEH